VKTLMQIIPGMRATIRRPAARVLAVAAAGLAGLTLLVSASAGTTAVPPPPTVFVSPTGSDANPGSAALPVLTVERAYQLALPGQTVELAAGSYPDQQLAFDPKKTSSEHVTFQPAPGATVTISQLDFGQGQTGVAGPQHLTLRNLTIGYLRAWDGTQDVTWLNISGKSFDILSYSGTTFGPANNITVLGGNFGPCQAPQDGACTVRLSGTNITVDGTSIHDATSTDLVNYHVDGMFIRGCSACVVRRAKFWGNMITNIRIQDCCGLPANANVTLENNLFGTSSNGDGSPRGDGVDVDTPTAGLMLRNNSFAENSGPLFDAPDFNGTNTQVVGNLMVNLPQSCLAGIVYSHNVYIPFSPSSGTRPCGPTDRRVRRFGYTNPLTLDFHLVPRSPAIGRGDPSSCAAVDIDGKARPKEVKCDAGADQRRDTAACEVTHKRGKTTHTTVWVSGIWLAANPHPKLTSGHCRGS
jgi:hypothetical protein